MLSAGTREHDPSWPPTPGCTSPFLFLPASAVAASRISARRRRRPWTCILPGEEGEGLECNAVARRGMVGYGQSARSQTEAASIALAHLCVRACVYIPMPCSLPPRRPHVLIASGRLLVHLSNCLWPGSCWTGRLFPSLQLPHCSVWG